MKLPWMMRHVWEVLRLARRALRPLRRAVRRTVPQHRPVRHRAARAVLRERERAKESDRAAWRSFAGRFESGSDRTDQADPGEALSRGGAIDRDWYRRAYGHLLRADEDPLEHYLHHGYLLGCAPNRHVDPGEVAARVASGDREPVSLALRLRAQPDSLELQRERLQERPHRLALDDAELRWRDLIEDRIREDDTFALYRIIGNDLPPRHKEGQGERNLHFLLEHEPDLEGCEKRYVVNRIVDPAVEERILHLLDTHRASYLHLPFDRSAYRRIGWRVSDFQRPGVLYGSTHDRMLAVSRTRAIDHAYHDKNLYAMNNNGARNAAFADGRALARWILPLDGNCFFTVSAWDRLRTEVLAAPHRRYMLIPMVRVADNHDLLQDPPPRLSEEEPQLGFRSDADELFDEDQRYGRRPKVELLRRLGVPGPWDAWPDEPWERGFAGVSKDVGEYHVAGWVARMASGQPTLEADDRQRMMSRMIGGRTLLAELDVALLSERMSRMRTTWWDEAVLAEQRRLGHVLGQPLRGPVEEAVDRWLPTTAHRDGPASSVTLTAGVVADALASELLTDPTLAERSSATLDALMHASGWTQLVEPWNLAALIDAVTCIRERGAISTATRDAFTEIVRQHRALLTGSAEGRRRRRRFDSRGTWYEVEMAACSRYLDDADELVEGSRRVAARFHDQFDLIPRLRRGWWKRVSRPGNLIAWSRLLHLHGRLDIPLCDPGSQASEGFQKAVQRGLQGARDSPETEITLSHYLADYGAETPVPRLESLQTSTLEGVTPLWWAGIVRPARRVSPPRS